MSASEAVWKIISLIIVVPFSFRVAREAELLGKADTEQENDPPKRVIFEDSWLLASVTVAARRVRLGSGYLLISLPWDLRHWWSRRH
jgi:hypothetical protein